ncbi:hypothetical protein DICSQDRAFT_172701 [Dichomitus squalens LYAD-421 SS1]|uniref:BTB domain-containing protein n=1 Tax=Dichomitus squalens (strain LYAD-421) TaxID=732165 RepID=R7SUS3_DICSQ|nr:uncharacterized protein DICSQDRAFT_172701 [Dichomitus squalens LYAD-421 SS1]EJF58692.1 hypothetical protein DICSQDRAFT_172701 [Dichomitus squalens LYAD-421 SS1]
MFVAEDTEFRVYKVPLSKHSAVFKDMFSLPQPAAASADEPPVVYLTERPKCFRYLLRQLISLEQLVRQVADYLASQYPTTYEAYAAITVEDHITGSDPSIHHIAVVNRATLSDTPSLLPSALFACCSIPPNRLVQEQLSLDDLTRVLVGRAELTKLDAEAAVAIFQPSSSPDCRKGRSPSCGELFLTAVTLLGSKIGLKLFGPSWELSWVDYANDRGLFFCPACEKMIARREDEKRKEIWKRLPSILGLEADG